GRVRVDAPEEDQVALGTLGEQLGAPMLVRILETLGQAVVDMRGTDAADPRLVLEIALVRLARREAGTPLQALAERIDRLERGVALTAKLGRRMMFKPVPHDGFGEQPIQAPDREPDDDEEMLDLAETVDAPATAPGVDSVSLITQSFGATVVEEVPRD